jgi:hypothetical protein
LTHIESSGGKNKDHPEVKGGLNRGHRAGGRVGLMPITVLETIKKNPDLAEKYHHITKMTPAQITDHVNNNEDFEAEIANRHWKRLDRVFGSDKVRKVFAWNQGIKGAKNASDEEILNHPYVQKYIQHAGRQLAENKIEKNDAELYRIHVDGNPITHPMTMKQLKEKHGDLARLEKDPSIRIVPHKPTTTRPKPKKGITFIKNDDPSAKADHYSHLLHQAKKNKKASKEELMYHAAIAIQAHDTAAKYHKKQNNDKATQYHKRQAKDARDFAHSLGTDHSGIMRRILNKKETEPCLTEGQESLKKPYESEAQRRWAHTKAGTKALGGKAAVKEWDKKSKGKELPEKVVGKK